MRSSVLRVAHLNEREDFTLMGGSTQMLVALCRGMSESGFRCSAVIQGKLEPGRKDQIQKTLGISIDDNHPAVSQLAEALRAYDIACIHHSGKFHTAMWAAGLAQVPVVVELLYNPASGLQYPWIDWAICVSRSIHAIQPFPERASVIYNGIDLKRFEFDRPPLSTARTLRLLQVGLHTDVDADAMRKLIEILHSRNLPCTGTIAGIDGPSDDTVRFLGFRTDIEKVYRDADILLHFVPIHEGFGLQVVEAMAAGVIPVVAEADGPAEIVEHGKNGFVFPRGDLSRAADHIETVWKGILAAPMPPHHDPRDASPSLTLPLEGGGVGGGEARGMGCPQTERMGGRIADEIITAAKERSQYFRSGRMVREYCDLFRKLWDHRAPAKPSPPTAPLADEIHAAFELLLTENYGRFIDWVLNHFEVGGASQYPGSRRGVSSDAPSLRAFRSREESARGEPVEPRGGSGASSQGLSDGFAPLYDFLETQKRLAPRSLIGARSADFLTHTLQPLSLAMEQSDRLTTSFLLGQLIQLLELDPSRRSEMLSRLAAILDLPSDAFELLTRIRGRILLLQLADLPQPPDLASAADTLHAALWQRDPGHIALSCDSARAAWQDSSQGQPV